MLASRLGGAVSPTALGCDYAMVACQVVLSVPYMGYCGELLGQTPGKSTEQL